ncbi:cytidine deaminase [Mycoplasma sp. Mirounga ES2805-ORL]|uniref:cytidine deaminase n=1 Tax=Mycoplasma sp. Mirounga ES2805-ORL TaxID=754514 RepID=UPI00197B707B|nr:cytidine deaminase [Mycoplasma sp. Mirounga ES2805-ORL]QSF13473.1 cytidine deaminase [Mycoplasma sp. Mirounga ES2805-ORL]
MEFKKLQKLLERSYCPYSHFRVAAIAIDSKGDEYPGVNVENAAYPSGLCAERSALFGSVAHGAKVGDFKEIYLITSSDDIAYPCGGCRQVITEFMQDDAIIHMYNYDGTKYVKYRVDEVMPGGFRLKDLK